MTLSSKNIVALLPMKRSSERIPNKNFKSFNGQPLFLWILDTLLNVREISKVVINTDAVTEVSELLPKSTQDKVVLRNRHQGICGDNVSMNLVLEDDIKNIPADYYLMTHTTNPLLSVETINKAINIFLREVTNNATDSLFSVTKFQSRFYRANGSPINHDPRNLVRTQDLEPWYEENSNLYIFSEKSFFLQHSRIGNNPFLFEVPKYESVDIDEEETWKLAELVSKGRR